MSGRLGIIGGHSLPTAEFAQDSDLEVVNGIELLTTNDVVTLARHGISSFTPAYRIDHQRTLAALAAVGVNRVVAFASVGSLRTDWGVGSVMVPDDVFAPWINPSIFDDGRGHSMPGFDDGWRAQVIAAWRSAVETPIHDGGVYVHTMGPRFETRAEIRFYASVADVVGMTIAAECIVAKELGLAYAAICTVDNMANGVADVPLTVDEFRAGVAANHHRMLHDATALVGELSRAGQPS